MLYGRAASENAPTSTEILQLASEQDGTRDGRDKEEEKRRKEEDWAVYTELNKKGAGNTMNRG
jgi:immunoglobulin-binding protein 1